MSDLPVSEQVVWVAALSRRNLCEKVSRLSFRAGSLAGEVGGLYGQVGGADVAPTSTQMAALAAVQKDYGEVMGRWKAIKSTNLPALNSQLSAGGLTVIKLQAEPEPASETENEE